ncbi:MAG: hypothetical protein L6R43_04390 [Planctomycetes bacterium]|nr:hypothetical protein [Planctomycetota bacterium]
MGFPATAALVLSLSLFLLPTSAPLPAAAADAASAMASLEDPSKGPDLLLGLLPDAARDIAADPGLSLEGERFTVCARGETGDREALLRAVEAADAKGRAALGEIGQEAVVLPGRTVVLFVSCPPGSAAAVADRAVLLLRAPGDGGTAPAAPPKRIDGLPLERDLLPMGRLQARRLGAERDRVAAYGGFERLLARRLLVEAAVPSAVPAWFREGLAGWLAGRMTGNPAPVPLHFPKGLAAGDRKAAEALLAASPPPAAILPALDAAVGRLLAKCGPLPPVLAKLAAGGGPAEWKAALGADPVDALLESAAALAAAGPNCPAEGTLPCGLCNGARRLEVDCPECEGGGALACPSCRGSSACWAGNCEKGVQVYEGGKKVRCKFCSGGTTTCKACRATKKTSCLPCRGAGRVDRACPGCVKGVVPCPHGGAAAAAPCERCAGRLEAPCPWCAAGGSAHRCPACGGSGQKGCRTCWGTGRDLCGDCGGTGETRMVYTDGTTASASKCGDCNGRGFADCRACEGGKSDCGECAGKGLGRGRRPSCPACAATGTVPCALCPGSAPPPGPASLDPGDSEANARAVEKAVAFLMTCRDGSGIFCLRKERSELKPGERKPAGALLKASTFSNSHVLWTLLAAGIPRDDPRLAASWRRARADAERIVEGKDREEGVQAAAYTLRCLLLGGEGPEGPLVRGLVDALVAAQRGNGRWNDALDGSGDEDNDLNTLLAAEALHVARTRGARIPVACWGKALRAATDSFGSKGPTKASKGRLDGIDVTCSLALLAMAKAGTLGEGAGSFDYLSLPDVKAGLAWLDRHMDVARAPVFLGGALFRQEGGGAHLAWLFSLQRLAMLLRVEEIGGDRWFVTGSRLLRTLQRDDGSFEETGPFAANGSVRGTCSSILFLLRATVPITEPGGGK